jgi:hypothetical protein
MVAMNAPASAQNTPGTLTIDELAPQIVRDRAALTRALQPCARARRCNNVALETCDRCWIIAERSGKGYSLHLRTGPPGPFYIAVRSDPVKPKTFTLREAETILARNLGGGPAEPGWFRWVEEDVFQ